MQPHTEPAEATQAANPRDNATASSPELAEVIGRSRGDRRAKRLRRLLAVAVLLALAAAGYLFFSTRQDASAPRYQTARIERGNLQVTVTATGNLQPTNQVDVGSELSGTMESVLVDVNDRVRRGQLLARLDVSRLDDQLANARATLAAAQAQVDLAAATAKEARLNLDRFNRMFEVSGGTVPSRADLDTVAASSQRAQAALAGARAAVTQARASLSSSETNLAKASIRSPIDGVVLSRQIEPGQTVAASLQAPVLFTLAENLSRMELQVDVDEADVGQVHDGQTATFTVDAYPERTYPARVRRVGYGSQTKDGVVSYLTVLTVDNDDLSLRPGMTATATILADERRDVLLLPNAALRYAPPDNATTERRSLVSRLVPRPPHNMSSRPVQPAGNARTVWVLSHGQPTAVTITVGASNGRVTELASGNLEPGTPVITGSSGGTP